MTITIQLCWHILQHKIEKYRNSFHQHFVLTKIRPSILKTGALSLWDQKKKKFELPVFVFIVTILYCTCTCPSVTRNPYSTLPCSEAAWRMWCCCRRSVSLSDSCHGYRPHCQKRCWGWVAHWLREFSGNSQSLRTQKLSYKPGAAMGS